MKFGLDSLKSVSKFFSYRNDIDIFTEDKDADKEFYKALFKNLLGDKIRINDVTPLGCKNNVINAYQSQDKFDGRKKIFIVDGDLDLLNSINVTEKNLVTLDSYCIENYLVEETGITQLLYFNCGSDSMETIKNKLNFEQWLNYNTSTLTELFINFAIFKKIGGGPKILTAHHFLTTYRKQTILDKNKVQVYSLEIYNEIIKMLENIGLTSTEANKMYFDFHDEIKKNWEVNPNTYLQVVSAKNYILPLLQFRINHCSNKGSSLIPKSSLKLFLASNCKLDRLKFLKDKIHKL